ncbi:hypothetical protein BpHYR1_003542 [Brachionus plicatilis]|uniref:Uncharacterized protein n=1 Tax=Brachionus plicatilis TaxID=10195 RepID=A0A3M7QEI3_BRAPC|nr:hypothetical protein BpHYR1_003542 [Brachionus plicatilis]
MPRSFQEQYPEQMKNLRLNSRKLTTPFDIYETFKDLLNFENIERPHKKPPRGISLFRHIPSNRSCEDAQIEAHWCSCLNWKNIDITLNTSKSIQNFTSNQNIIARFSQSDIKNFSQSTSKAGNLNFSTFEHLESKLGQYSHLALFLAFESVKFINSLIDKELKFYCYQLRLYSIHKLSRLIINRQVLAFKQSKDIHGREALFEENSNIEKYFENDMLKPVELNNSNVSRVVGDHLNFEHVFQIVLTTWPGNATFELACRYNRYTGKIKFNKNEISRINSYKSSANCIMDKRPDLRAYCFCKYF